jgi:hypothetical protein
MTFSHPLAWCAKVFAAHSLDGKEQQILVMVTTVELDPHSGRYKKGLVERLSAAAHDYVAKSDHVTAFILMNRPKDWPRPAEAHRRHPGVPRTRERYLSCYTKGHRI